MASYSKNPLNNPLNDVGHFEGESWYDPTTSEMKRIMMDSDGKWMAVSEDHYNRTHSVAVGERSCAVGQYSYSVGENSHTMGCAIPQGVYGTYCQQGQCNVMTGVTHTENSKFLGAVYETPKVANNTHMADIEVY